MYPYTQTQPDNSQAWPPGPWHKEINEDSWITQAGHPGVVLRHRHFGTLNGYVGVPKEHPLHGEHYDTPDIEIHGGLTFAAVGEDNELWWFGFDTNHNIDLCPSMIETIGRRWQGVYRQFYYVRCEVENLAQQLKELESWTPGS